MKTTRSLSLLVLSLSLAGCITFPTRVLTVSEFVHGHAGGGGDPVAVRGRIDAVLNDQSFELVGDDGTKIPVLFRYGSLPAASNHEIVVSGEAMLIRPDTAHGAAPGVYAMSIRPELLPSAPQAPAIASRKTLSKR